MITTGLAVFWSSFTFPFFFLFAVTGSFFLLAVLVRFPGITTCVIRQTLCRLRTLHSPDCHKCFTLLQGAYLENDFQLNRGAERKACHSVDQAARVLLFSEDVVQQLRSAV
jgi:hypothetical protein